VKTAGRWQESGNGVTLNRNSERIPRGGSALFDPKNTKSNY